MTTIAILQPGFLPWLGFFDQMLRCDIFVYYDDVQFDKHGWRNRNRIKAPSGPLWVTIPVLHSGKQGQRIIDTEVDNNKSWARKMIATIRQNYVRAPHLAFYLPELELVLAAPWRFLVDLDLAVADLMCRWFEVKRPVFRASALGIPGGKSSRLLSICQHFSATRYLSGNAAQDYLDVALFEDAGIAVEWQNYRHPTYPQLHGDFIPYLSALDLVLNAGRDSISILRGTA
ncbi:MAG TPA: WbqC family protein [Methylocella sp.]|nr:WbqC family protein [Methylocella sp.]